MSTTPRILALAGSTRTGSYNKQLARLAARYAEEEGAEVTFADLRDFPMPLYDGDLEEAEGLPAEALRLKGLMLANDGFLISSPEYNSSISGVLKNAIDWVSRPVPNEPPLVAYRGKVVSLLSASPGALGGLRGLVTVRSILGNIGVIVLPDQLAIAKAHEAFDAEGNLKDANLSGQVHGIAKGLVQTVARLKGHPLK